MKAFHHSLVLALCIGVAGCSDDDTDPNSSFDLGPDATSDAGGDSEDPNDDGGTDLDAGDDTGADTNPDASTNTGDCNEMNTSIDSCKDERTDVLNPIDEVTEGEVKILSTDGSTLSIYVDASAGGAMNAASNPYVYIKLGTGDRVDVTDVTAASSLDWDLAIKRTVFATNSGHWGPGVGGALFLEGKAFDTVTVGDAAGASIPQEALFDGSCNANLDGRGSPVTTFGTWYDYDPQTHATPPKDGTFLVRAADCSLFKVRIESNTATPEGGTDGLTTARYLLSVAPL